MSLIDLNELHYISLIDKVVNNRCSLIITMYPLVQLCVMYKIHQDINILHIE
jgi:hypothetical protein